MAPSPTPVQRRPRRTPQPTGPPVNSMMAVVLAWVLPMVPVAASGRVPWTFVLPGSIFAFPVFGFGAIPFAIAALAATILAVAIVHAATDSKGPALLVIAAGTCGVSVLVAGLLAS